MTLIKCFKEISKFDISSAGGKGASLGEMINAEIPIPDGFVVLTIAFDEFLEEGGLGDKIDKVLSSVDIGSVDSIKIASEDIQKMIFSKKISKNTREAIFLNFKKLNSKYVAVRSSATAEDSAEATWAGQLDSYLNTTEEKLIENIKKCWASLFSVRAIFYRIEKKLDKDKISVAVVVQIMIQADVSGVAFSVHPVTQDKNQILIEAGFGLGEAIVSGAITPDGYIINKQNCSLIDLKTNNQTKKIVRNNDGGNCWVELGDDGKRQVLRGEEIVELSKLIIKIESHYGFPCDIEWAKENDKFHILQSRPIINIVNIEQKKLNIFEYIKSQEWFFGIRANESLLFYSAKHRGGGEYIKKEYGIRFADTLLFPLEGSCPVRVFNLAQAKKFHAISNEKIFENPHILDFYIKKNNLLFNEIELKGQRLIKLIKKNKYEESINIVKDIFSLYELSGAQFIIIFSLGLKLAENKDILEGNKKYNRGT